ncbi:unnamed protein product [Withania somnifera]
MASMQCYKEEGKEFDYYSTYKSCYDTKPGMMGYGASHGTNPMGYGTEHNHTHRMGYGHNTHSGNHPIHKPGSNGLGMGLCLGTGTSLGFGETHEGHVMGSSGCTTYKKQHRRRKAMGGYGSDSSDDERHC